MKKLVLVVESSQRGDKPLTAKEYYAGKYSRWVNKIIEYLDLTGEVENAYFLQISKGDVVGFNEIVEPYTKADITKDKLNAIVQRVSEMLVGIDRVDLHCGQNIGIPLMKMLKDKGIEYKMYAEGYPLATKPIYYDELIAAEQEKLKAKELKTKIVSTIGAKTETSYERAMSLIELSGLNNKYNLDNIDEIKYLAMKYHQKRIQMVKSKFELDESEVLDFNFVTDVTQLYADIERYEKLKRTNGKLLAKIERYLIKVDYFKQAEVKLDAALLRATIQLMKII